MASFMIFVFHIPFQSRTNQMVRPSCGQEHATATSRGTNLAPMLNTATREPLAPSDGLAQDGISWCEAKHSSRSHKCRRPQIYLSGLRTAPKSAAREHGTENWISREDERERDFSPRIDQFYLSRSYDIAAATGSEITLSTDNPANPAQGLSGRAPAVASLKYKPAASMRESRCSSV